MSVCYLPVHVSVVFGHFMNKTIFILSYSALKITKFKYPEKNHVSIHETNENNMWIYSKFP